MSAISIRPEDNGIMHPPLLNSIKSLTKQTNMCIVPPTVSKVVLLMATQLIASLLHHLQLQIIRIVVKFNSGGKYECDVSCIWYKSYKICSHTVAAAEHKSELRNFV